MPPKGSGKPLEGKYIQRCEEILKCYFGVAGFRYNEDRTKIQCKICPEHRTWIAIASATRHLTSPSHLQAVDLARSAQQAKEALEKEREADSATSKLRDVQFATTQLVNGPIAAASSRVMSEAEAEMWADYRMNGAEFSAGDEPDKPEAMEQQLRQEAEIFGLWNPDAMARKLGFGDDDQAGSIEEDGEDDFLADILRNVGE